MVTTTIRLRAEQLAKYRTVAQIKTDAALAERMGVDPATVSRVLAGSQKPGPTFMGALVGAFPGLTLDDLFEAVGVDEKAVA